LPRLIEARNFPVGAKAERMEGAMFIFFPLEG